MSEQVTNLEPFSSGEAKWQKFVTTAFSAAGLPEVVEDQLEPGTYTNARIAETFRDDPLRLVSLLMNMSSLDNQVVKRNILSFTMELIESEKDDLPE